jgi:prepilin-type processing-associated H-X9-DG protein
MQCPNCRFENAEGAKTCARCGIVLNLRDVDLSDLQPRDPEPKPQPPAGNKGLTCGLSACVIVALLLFGLFVIAMVGAIVTPVFFRAREKAQQTSCLSNLKQLELATVMYAQDYGSVMPPASDWCDLTYPSVKNKQVYVCPQTSGAVGSYAMNDSLSGRELSVITSPAQTVSLFDSTTGWNIHGGPSLIANRHNGGANFGFADGHVKWVNGGSASRYTWTVAAVPPPTSGSTSSGP